MEDLLATVDKVFKVEQMKLPPALQNTLMGDLISGESLKFKSVSLFAPRDGFKRVGASGVKPETSFGPLLMQITVATLIGSLISRYQSMHDQFDLSSG